MTKRLHFYIICIGTNGQKNNLNFFFLNAHLGYPLNDIVKINRRNRLLKCFKCNPNTELKTRISNLNFEIRAHFFTKKRLNVCKGILPNNSKSLWHAVKVAKNISESIIPSNMSLNIIPYQLNGTRQNVCVNPKVCV